MSFTRPILFGSLDEFFFRSDILASRVVGVWGLMDSDAVLKPTESLLDCSDELAGGKPFGDSVDGRLMYDGSLWEIGFEGSKRRY